MGVIYKNSPLVELVAEIQWTLTPLTVAPGAAIDPFFDVLRADLTNAMRDGGYGLVEDVVPPQFPREMLAWKATTRFSQSSNGWPKFQVGPGVFTVNIAGPSYKGWEIFREFLDSGFTAFFASYPDVPRLLKPKSLQLRYVNVFTDKQGYLDHAQFTSTVLGLSPILPAAFISRLGIDKGRISTSSNSRFPVPNLSETIATIQVTEASVNNKSSCITHFGLECVQNPPSSKAAVMKWLDSAHSYADRMFDELMSDDIKKTMIPESAP